jgi:phosphoribosylformylglycinamidine cyclo-ligase
MDGSGTGEGGREGLSYRDAGVDIDAQDEALRRIKSVLKATRTPGVLADLGAFGGMFAPDLTGIARPVLVASCDGVGTKLKVAFAAGVHDTIGRDLVNHCVNDILVQGARPLFFLDYVATGKLDPAILASVVEGIAKGCRENGCALLGGETAEMPGFYSEGEYDVAGFIVGLVDRDKVLDGSRVAAGDVLVGLPSAGLHTNGYSLARKILFERMGLSVSDRVETLQGTVGEVLLAEHRSYLRVLDEPLARGWLHALAHITGGGLTDNLPRVLPEGADARIDRGRWEVPSLFRLLEREGRVGDAEMFRTFNMGIGMVAIVPPDRLADFLAHLERLGERHFRIGEIVPGDGRVRYA